MRCFPQLIKERMKLKKVTINRAKCKLCGDVLTSTDEQLVQICTCKSLLVDGGTSFIQRGLYAGRENYIELSEFEEIEILEK